MEFICEKTVEVLEDEIIIHQQGEYSKPQKKATLDDIFRMYGTKEDQEAWFPPRGN